MNMKDKSKGIYVYEVYPTNFRSLSEERQDLIIDIFRRFLNSLASDIRILAVKTERNVKVLDIEVPTVYYRFFIESHGSPLNYIFEKLGYKYQQITETPDFTPIKVFRGHIAMPGGILIKTYTVYRLPGSLVEGFISETYGLAERIIITIKPLPQEAAVKKIGRYARLLRGIVLAEQAKGRRPSDEILVKHGIVTSTYQSLISGVTKLFKVKVNISVAGKSLKELREKSRLLRQVLQGRMIGIDSPRIIQYGLAEGFEGKNLIMDTETLGAFYPFIGADLIEAPGGVFLGINRETGGPVIYDPWLRMNQNILLVGKPGSGKSFATKLLLSRLASKMKELAFYIIDPENEYGYLGKLLGGRVINVEPDRKLGLDPIQTFKESKDTAANIIADITGIRERRLITELRNLTAKRESIFEVYSDATEDLKDYLEPLIEGPDSFLMDGKPIKFSKRMIFDLSGLHREFSTRHEELTLLKAASILIFCKVWSILDNQEFIPLQTPKFVAVDEVWLYTTMPSSAGFLENVSRRGRKRNVIFTLCTQRVSDVLEGLTGKTLVENCASKILLRQDEASIGMIGEVFGLSESEREDILELEPGQAILIAENIHVPVDFVATREEYAIFTTKPSERITLTYT